jgi:hypothetical protein
MREHESEPVPGLPEQLPDGETILWQGAPAWRQFAVRTFHLYGLAGYFALLAGWQLLGGAPASLAEAAAALLQTAAFGAVPVVLLLGLGRLSARAALYTITGQRIVMRVGVAVPVAVNIPFSAIRSADLRLNRDGTGDILLRLMPARRMSYVALWPHCSLLRLTQPVPMLRALPDAEAAARALSQALAASAAMPVRALHAAGAEDGRAGRPEAAAAA